MGKEAYEQLQDAWLIEMAELSATKKAEAEAVKHFILKREDIYRVAYGKRVAKFPRQCIFFGITNDSEFLRDKTSNRRFWPVEVGVSKRKKDLWSDMAQSEIDQIWVELFHGEQKNMNSSLSTDINESIKKIQGWEPYTKGTGKLKFVKSYGYQM